MSDESINQSAADAERPRRNRRRRFIAGMVIACGGAAAGIALGRINTETPPVEPSKHALNPPVVVVAPVKREDLSRQIHIAAEFHPFQQVDLHAKVAGYVQTMKVDVGDRVKEGDVLATLEVPELKDDLRKARAMMDRSKHEAARAKAAYEDAHLSYTRLTDVMKQHPNLVAQQDVDGARAHDETAHASWVAAQSAIEEAEANVTQIQDMLDYCRIVAPFDGVITERYADAGALLGSGTSAGNQTLVRISQMNPLRLVLPVPESAVASVHVGDEVTVSLDSLHKSFAARISRISDEIMTDTRTMHVEVDVKNPDLSLAPGMYATVALTLENHRQALSIPIQTVPAHKNNSASVFVLNKNHKLEEHRITLGMETPTRVEVISGLAENDLVVMGNQGAFQPGEEVDPKVASKGDLE